MTIIAIKIMTIIAILACYNNYSYYTNYLFQIGWNLWALEYYTSLITGNLFSMSSPFKAFWESLRLCLLETQEPFRTTCATSFRAHPRPPAGSRRRMRDVVCQLVGIGMVP
jgi:hypothetical protein